MKRRAFVVAAALGFVVPTAGSAREVHGSTDSYAEPGVADGAAVEGGEGDVAHHVGEDGWQERVEVGGLRGAARGVGRGVPHLEGDTVAGERRDADGNAVLGGIVGQGEGLGFGGGGFFVHHDARTGKIETIDGPETAPASAIPARFLTADGKTNGIMQAVGGPRSVGVPGNIPLKAMAQQRRATLPSKP